MQHKARVVGCFVLVTLVSLPAPVAAGAVSPIEKVIELLTELQAKLVSDGEAEAAAYHDYYEWCEDASRELQNEIKTLTSQKGKLEATIVKASSDIEEAETAIEEVTAHLAEDDTALTDATVIRKKERADFEIAEGELTTAIDMLGRAVAVLEREMQGGAALVQRSASSVNIGSLLSGVATVIDAAAFSADDRERIAALLQQQSDAEDTGAPAAAVYENKSGGIVEVLEDMKEKAETQLGEARKAEMKAQHNYDLLKQSLDDATAAGEKELANQKLSKGKASEEKATAEGDLEIAIAGLKHAEEKLEHTRTHCMQVATDHDTTVAGRKAELAAVTEAKKLVQASTAFTQQDVASFLQVRSTSRSRTAATGPQVVSLIKQLASRQHDTALLSLASKIQAVLRYGSSSGADPFAKVKGLISSMIEKLMREAEEEADEKAYCDSEMKKTTDKRLDLEDAVEDLTVKLDKAAAASQQAKKEVATLQSELAALLKLQAEMDTAREEGHAAYLAAKDDLNQGLSGVRGALQVLRDYYGDKEETAEAALLQDQSSFSAFMQQPAPPEKHEASSGAGGSVIGLLEVCEADLAKNLAETETEEADAQEVYDKTTQENKVTKAEKEQDAKYKTKSFKALDKTITELESDRDTANTELDAVKEYDAKLKDRCVAKPETYEERTRRRKAEIEGLKEALAILEGDAVFLQARRVVRSGNLRG